MTLSLHYRTTMVREAVLEVTGQTTPTHAPPSASGTPILSQVSTGHRNLATDPTINTQNQHDHTEQTSTRPLYNAAHATANLISCMGELTHPTLNHTHSTSSSLSLGQQIPILSETATLKEACAKGERSHAMGDTPWGNAY